MTADIKNIWIETEDKGAILIGQECTDDNSDVIVTFSDNTSYVATFFTYENIRTLTRKNKESGECLSGKYFWASDMILIESLDRATIEVVVHELLTSGEFKRSFTLIDNCSYRLRLHNGGLQ